MNLVSSFNSLHGARIHTLLVAVFFTILTLVMSAPRAIADDINPDADIPDASTLDSTPANPVLELPQQCDQDSVAMLCNKSSADATSTADAEAEGSNFAGDPSGYSAGGYAANVDVGSANDYANQNVANDAMMAGMLNAPSGGYNMTGYNMSGYNVPSGYYVPSYPALAPAPGYVAPGPGGYQQWASGPGTYQQWARGPGTYQQLAPGPGYIQPMAPAFHPYGLGGSFGSMPLGGIGGSHFGHR